MAKVAVSPKLTMLGLLGGTGGISPKKGDEKLPTARFRSAKPRKD
jgi:hypothetical protein